MNILMYLQIAISLVLIVTVYSNTSMGNNGLAGLMGNNSDKKGGSKLRKSDKGFIFVLSLFFIIPIGSIFSQKFNDKQEDKAQITSLIEKDSKNPNNIIDNVNIIKDIKSIEEVSKDVE